MRREGSTREPLYVWAILWIYGLSALLFVATSYTRNWLWFPWTLLTVIWACLRIGQAYPRKSGENLEHARNMNMGREKTPFTVHAISAVIMAVILWYLLWGSAIHPLAGMPHAPLLTI